MKRMLGLLFVLMIVLTNSTSLADDVHNTKLLIHSSRPVTEGSSWSLAGWAIFPNIGNGPVIMIGGSRYESTNWWLETMAGSLSKDSDGQLLFDVRASYGTKDPIKFWTNIQYFPDTSNWYFYLETNYRVGNFGLIGLETENTFTDTESALSIGPHVVLPLGKVTLVGAYQFHNSGNANQAWTRAVINF